MTLWMITGNATADGAPIYLQLDGRWTRRLAEGLALSSEAQRDALLAQAQASERIVCDAYVIEVRQSAGGQLEATGLRERIRAEGPTVALVSAQPLRPAAAIA
ncbi:MAG: DUF2849 domain-containing protein [Enhygromyxa sp.]